MRSIADSNATDRGDNPWSVLSVALEPPCSFDPASNDPFYHFVPRQVYENQNARDETTLKMAALRAACDAAQQEGGADAALNEIFGLLEPYENKAKEPFEKKRRSLLSLLLYFARKSF